MTVPRRLCEDSLGGPIGRQRAHSGGECHGSARAGYEHSEDGVRRHDDGRARPGHHRDRHSAGLGFDAGTGPQTASFKAIVDPVLAPGQFRKATATASLTGTGFIGHVDPNMPNQVAAQWSIDEVEATLDDETGGIEVRIEVTVSANAQGFSASVQALGIQVTTLARV